MLNARSIGIVLGAAIVVSAAASLVASSLVINGKTTSADVRMIDGSAYVRLSDVARALDMTLVKTGSRYEFAKSGGANQIGNLQGKIGDTLFDGKWRFTVLSVETPSSYTMTFESEPYDAAGKTLFDRTSRVITAARGYKLYVLRCRVANGVKERRTLWTAISDDRIRTALADSDGSSHPPVAYDFSGAPTQTQWLLPGAQLTFSVIFPVPEAATVKDLIFTLKNNQGDDKGNDVRVSLARP